MAKRAMHLCAYPGCSELVRYTRYCTRHQEKAQKRYQQRQQEANKHYNRHKRDKQIERFYRSTAWRMVRVQALSRDHYLCKDCLEQHRITSAVTIHHIIPIRDDWSKRLDINNCRSLCDACHNRRHNRGGSSR